jgi:Dehydrogenases with different specificities (related to short-chain alcohol dehydrogenases)
MEARLDGRIAVVTGVSRRAGIGFAIASRLLAEGASVFVHSWSPHDAEQAWGADPGGVDAVLDPLGDPERIGHLAADLSHPDAPAAVFDAARERFGSVDVLIANHARSSAQSLETLTAAELDASWAVNARATLLLVQAFAAHHDDARRGGRVILFTSGQHLAPMTDELPYAVSKGAIHQMTRSLADHLADRRITVNAINPGPTDTGWAAPELEELVQRAMPFGRWGSPADAANLVSFLVSDEGAWITGQVIDSEGGFRRA